MTRDFQTVVDALGDAPAVTSGKMFGAQALKVSGKVFSMRVKDRLVVKLPQARAKELINQGFAEPFDPGHGRVMKEWVSIAPTAEIDWVKISREARTFVQGAQR